MAIKKYNVEVVRTDEYEIEVDETIWTQEAIDLWSETFFEAENVDDLVKYLSEALSQKEEPGYMEGFGFVKQKYAGNEDSPFVIQTRNEKYIVQDHEYTNGLVVNIISKKDQIESEVLQLTFNKS